MVGSVAQDKFTPKEARQFVNDNEQDGNGLPKVDQAQVYRLIKKLNTRKSRSIGQPINIDIQLLMLY